jgi:hypothetical protein
MRRILTVDLVAPRAAEGGAGGGRLGIVVVSLHRSRRVVARREGRAGLLARLAVEAGEETGSTREAGPAVRGRTSGVAAV